MIKAVNSYNFEEEISKSRSQQICHSVISFPDGSEIYIKDKSKENGDRLDGNGMQLDESSEVSNDDLNASLTREEWETVLTLNSLEYLIVFRSTKRIGRRNRKNRKQYQSRSFSILESQSKESGGIVQKRKRASPLKSETHQCPNCLTTDSALWRNCVIRGKSHHFCNACGLRFKKGKFCPLCYKVYYDADTNTREWKQCNICFNWTHRQCLRDSGKEMDGDYTCNLCRHEE